VRTALEGPSDETAEYDHYKHSPAIRRGCCHEKDYGSTIYVTCEGKVMHFFDEKSEMNLLV